MCKTAKSLPGSDTRLLLMRSWVSLTREASSNTMVCPGATWDHDFWLSTMNCEYLVKITWDSLLCTLPESSCPPLKPLSCCKEALGAPMGPIDLSAAHPAASILWAGSAGRCLLKDNFLFPLGNYPWECWRPVMSLISDFLHNSRAHSSAQSSLLSFNSPSHCEWPSDYIKTIMSLSRIFSLSDKTVF